MLSREQYMKDAEILRKAMAGWGCDEKPIIEITVKRTNADRQMILKEYKTMYGRDGLADLEDELGGDLGRTIQAMYRTTSDYDATELYKAMKGAGTDEDVLIEIIGTRTPQELEKIKESFTKLYKEDLEKWVISETSGDFRNLLVSLLQCGRSSETNVDILKLGKDVQNLYEAGEAKVGTDESVFNSVFAVRSKAELKYISTEYVRATGKSLFQVIESEFSGDIKKLLTTVLLSNTNTPEYFARRIREACVGMGTNDKLLIRILVSRDEIDLKEIDAIYKKSYQMTLAEQIKDECSGDYKKLLLGLVSS